ncbi:MAG: radical SAM protein [Bacteroidales bacterium]|nr:radical SAM protein [Bacteroidales bacterium]
MATFLWSDIVFGPIHSRRVGTSLGINLLPVCGKLCTFDCIYCECGSMDSGAPKKDRRMPSYEQVAEAMSSRFKELFDQGVKVDSISFTGNGEPTLNKDFPAIVDKTVELRDKYFPAAVISVFSNSTTLDRPGVFDALMKVDNRIMKVDCSDIQILKDVNRPAGRFSLEKVLENLERFKGDFILQTMFFKGVVEGREIDLTAPELVAGWLDIVRRLRPYRIMAYSLDRDTPVDGLVKIGRERLQEITAPLRDEGFDVEIF